MTRTLARISLVLFLMIAVAYQSWSITVPPDSSDFLFTRAPAAKLTPSLFDIDDEHRGAHAALAIAPAALCLIGPSILLAQPHGHFRSELRFNHSSLHKTTVVLLI